MRKATKPIVVDLGRASPKKVRELKDGTGSLVDEVSEVIDRVRDELGGELQGKRLVPVIVVYKRKRRQRRESLIDLLF